MSDGKIPYERRFGQPFKGPIIPFGSFVEYHPILRRISHESINLERKFYLDCSSGTLCTREEFGRVDVLIADLEELETMDASEICSKRLNAKEVIFPKKEKSFFQSKMDESKPQEEDLRTSTLIRPRPIQGEGHIDFLGESEGSLPQPHDSLPDAGEAIHDFWSMSGSFIYRHAR